MSLLLASFSTSAIFMGVMAAGAPGTSVRDAFHRIDPSLQLAQARRTCQDMRSCREAVVLWCEGYSRADGDRDGIPCENVCSTLAEVEEIRAEIGC